MDKVIEMDSSPDTEQAFELKPFVSKPVAVNGDWVTSCEAFLKFQQVGRGLAFETIKAYRSDLQQLSAFAHSKQILVVQYACRPMVEDWIVWLSESLGNSGWSIRRKLACARQFFDWCLARQLLDVNPAANIRVTARREPKIAPKLSILLKEIDRMPQGSPMELRDHALIRVLMNAGMRATEPLSLKVWNDRNPPSCTVDKNGFVRFKKKGSLPGVNVLSEKTMKSLNAWLDVRADIAQPGVDEMFITPWGKPLKTRQRVYQLVKGVFSAANMDYVSPHLLKHARAAQVLEKTNGCWDTAQLALNHASRETTVAHYGHLSLEERLSKLAAIGGMDD